MQESNAPGTANLRREGSGVDLDALEAVARAAVAVTGERAGVWPTPEYDAAMDAFDEAFSPEGVLRLIEEQRELLGVLRDIAAGDFNCARHQRFMAAQGRAEAAIAKAEGRS